MNRKFWSIFSILVIAAMILAACAPAATETPAPTEPAAEEPTEAPAAEEPTEPAEATEAPTEPPAAEAVTISIWHQWDGRYLDAIEQSMRDYEAANPGITIDLSKPEDVASALNVAIPAGEGPDILAWANDKIGEQALNGNIVNLGDLGIDMAFLESTYEPAAVNGVIWRDTIWALPESQEGIALVYNTEVVTEEYLPADPLNFDDLLQKAQQFQEDTGNALVCNQGFGNQDAYHVAPIFFGFGVPSYVDDQGNVYMNTPEAIQAGQWLAEFREISLAENTYDICNANFVEGEVGMWWTGPWAVAGIEEAGIDYGIQPMGRPFVGIKTLMVTRNAVDRGNEQAALDIIRYFTSAEVQTNLALINKTIPAATAAIQNEEVQALPSVAGFGEAMNLGVPMANTPFASAQWVPVGDAAISIWNGTQTPEEALEAAQQTIEEQIAQMQ